MSPSVDQLHPLRSEAVRSHSPAQRPAQSPPSLMARGWLWSHQSALPCHAPRCTGRSQLPGLSPQHLSSPLRRAAGGCLCFQSCFSEERCSRFPAACLMPRALPTGTPPARTCLYSSGTLPPTASVARGSIRPRSPSLLGRGSGRCTARLALHPPPLPRVAVPCPQRVKCPVFSPEVVTALVPFTAAKPRVLPSSPVWRGLWGGVSRQPRPRLPCHASVLTPGPLLTIFKDWTLYKVASGFYNASFYIFRN